MSDPSPKSSAFWKLTRRIQNGEVARADAVLKNLLDPAQDLVASWCLEPSERNPETGKPIPGTDGFTKARAQLDAVGQSLSLAYLRGISERSLRSFLSWWGLKQDAQAARETQEQVLKETGDPRKAIDAGTNLLAVRGLARQDPELIALASRIHVATRTLDLEEVSGKTRAEIAKAKLKQKTIDQTLAREKFEFDAAKAALANLAELKAIARDRSLSEDQRIEQVRLRLWGAPPPKLEAPAS